MAIINFTNYSRGQSRGCMSSVMNYVMKDEKTKFNGQQLVTGINCTPQTVYGDFMTTKNLHHKTDGVLFYHMIQSFPKGEDVDPLTAHAASGWQSTTPVTRFWSALIPTVTISTRIF